MPERFPPLSDNDWLKINYFLNLLRPNAATPTKPDPSKKSVVGSGTGEGVPALEDVPPFMGVPPLEDVPPFVGVPALEDVPPFMDTEPESGEVNDFLTTLVSTNPVVDSFSGQPTIPKNMITVHKKIMDAFILPPREKK